MMNYRRWLMGMNLLIGFIVILWISMVVWPLISKPLQPPHPEPSPPPRYSMPPTPSPAATDTVPPSVLTTRPTLFTLAIGEIASIYMSWEPSIERHIWVRKDALTYPALAYPPDSNYAWTQYDANVTRTNDGYCITICTKISTSRLYHHDRDYLLLGWIQAESITVIGDPKE